MATNLVVMGLPVDIKFPKLLNKFRTYFKRLNIKMFWIRNITEAEGSQQVVIELVSMVDARKAKNFLNNQPFRYEMNEYLMEVHLEEGSREVGFPREGGFHKGNEGYERRPRPAKRNTPRSRSPGYSSEASKLDMEIELLRKQRQVIEEERRLLVEQKKLEMIKEYGPSAAREFDHFDDYEPPRKKRQPEPVSKRPRARSPPFAKIPRMPKMDRSKGLPVFFQPCKKLIGQMKPYIEKGTTPEEISILIKLIRATIRKELAMTLEGHGFISTLEILKLYREKHPKEEDEAFVAKILAKIRASCVTTATNAEKDTNLKEVKKEKVSDNETENAKGNKSETNGKATENDQNDTKDKENDNSDTKDTEIDDKGKEMGDEVADNETAPKDTANGENETDAGAPDAVNTELSQELENNSAGNFPEEGNTDIKTNDDTSVQDESAGDGPKGDDKAAEDDALGDGAAKGDDWVEDWNAEEPKEQ